MSNTATSFKTILCRKHLQTTMIVNQIVGFLGNGVRHLLKQKPSNPLQSLIHFFRLGKCVWHLHSAMTIGIAASQIFEANQVIRFWQMYRAVLIQMWRSNTSDYENRKSENWISWNWCQSSFTPKTSQSVAMSHSFFWDWNMCLTPACVTDTGLKIPQSVAMTHPSFWDWNMCLTPGLMF